MSVSAPVFSRVLVPYDGSEPSCAALALAIDCARRGASLVVLTAIDEAAIVARAMGPGAPYDPSELLAALDAQAEARLSEAIATCRYAGIGIETLTVREAPVAAILGTAVSHACDLIVMGTHGRNGIARAFLGGTTEDVLRASHVPVMTVRERAQPTSNVRALHASLRA